MYVYITYIYIYTYIYTYICIHIYTIKTITDSDLRIARDHCSLAQRRSLGKKSTTSCFNITMGSHDGGKIYEFVGVYILSHLETIIKKNEIGLYHDDGLLILQNANGQKNG